MNNIPSGARINVGNTASNQKPQKPDLTAMASRITLDSKNMLARLLATENILVEHNTQVHTAYFDSENRRLVLPAWDGLDNDTADMLIGHEVGHALFTPAGSKPVENALSYINSQLDLKNPNEATDIAKSYLNIVEDARIERMIKDRYPGLMHNFRRAYTKMFNEDKFQIRTAIQSGRLPLIDKLNMRAKIGTHVDTDIPLTPYEQSLFDEMIACETFEDVVRFTKKVYDLVSHPPSPPPPPGNSQGKKKSKNGKSGKNGEGSGTGKSSGKGDGKSGKSGKSKGNPDEDMVDADELGGSGRTTESDPSDSSDDENEETGENSDSPSDSENEGEENSEKDGSDSDADAEDSSEEDSDEKGKNGNDNSDDSADTDDDAECGNSTSPVTNVNDLEENKKNNKAPASITDGAYTKMVRSLSSNSSGGSDGIKYVDIPETSNGLDSICDYKKILDVSDKFYAAKLDLYQPYFDKLYVDFKRDSSTYVDMLVKDFEMKKAADTHARTSLSNSGVVNTNKLHSYKYNEDIFKRMANIREGKNHGIVMMIDWSGSMQGCIGSTIKQLLNLVHFCRRVSIPFEVYAFTDRLDMMQLAGLCDEKGTPTKKNRHSGHCLANLLSSRMSANEFSKTCKFLLHFGNVSEFHVASGTGAGTDHYSIPPVMNLNGTPLNASILDLYDIIPAFQKANNIQVVNMVILTDGEDSTSIFGSISSGTKILVVRDKKTRTQIATNMVNESGGIRNNVYTSSLLTMLRNRTNCNLVGFYLINASGGKRVLCDMSGITMNSPEGIEAVSFFKEKKYFEIKNCGYDTFFIIPSDELDTKLEAKDDYLQKNLTKGRLASAFIGTLNKRRVNRIVLSRFVDIIAKAREEFPMKKG